LLWFAPNVREQMEGAWAQTKLSGARARVRDAHGNVLDPATGCVDFAATFAQATPGRFCKPKRSRRTRLWDRLVTLLSKGAAAPANPIAGAV